MALAQAAVAAVTVARPRQNKNELPGRLRAWREMAASARTAVLEPTALPQAEPTALPQAAAKAQLREEGRARDCAMAQVLAAQMALVPW